MPKRTYSEKTELNKSFLKEKLRHLWNGELPFSTVFWSYYVFATFSFATLFWIGTAVNIFAPLLGSLVSLLWSIFMIVPMWRAAKNHQGSKAWVTFGLTTFFLGLVTQILVFMPYSHTKTDNSNNYKHVDYQRDADILRLHDLVYIGELIEEYYEQKQRNPLTHDGQKPKVVYILSKEQAATVEHDYSKSDPIDVSLFINELKEGLGKEIILPIDPQREKVNSKNIFYTYEIRSNGSYILSAFTHHGFMFAKRFSQHNNRVSIGSHALPKESIFLLDQLKKEKYFQEAFSAPPLKPGHLESIRKGLVQDIGYGSIPLK